jgi:hypothetical protein
MASVDDTANEGAAETDGSAGWKVNRPEVYEECVSEKDELQAAVNA